MILFSLIFRLNLINLNKNSVQLFVYFSFFRRWIVLLAIRFHSDFVVNDNFQRMTRLDGYFFRYFYFNKLNRKAISKTVGMDMHAYICIWMA